MGGNPIICPRTAPTRCCCLGHGPGFTPALRPRRNYWGEPKGAQGPQYPQPYCGAGLLAKGLLCPEEQRHRVRRCCGTVTTSESAPAPTGSASQPEKRKSRVTLGFGPTSRCAAAKGRPSPPSHHAPGRPCAPPGLRWHAGTSLSCRLLTCTSGGI